MPEILGSSGSLVLFSDGTNGAVVDKNFNLVVESGDSRQLLSSHPWGAHEGELSQAVIDLAAGALTDFEIRIVASAGRMYTIPKGVQAEAKKALEWRKEHKRGGTPVGLNTARTLSKGGQIGIEKVRHIAKYFPRHEMDKKAKGWEPGEEGFPSRGRIAWALWGSDAGWRWAQSIVDRENKKALVATGKTYENFDTYSMANGYDADVDAFKQAHKFGVEAGPEFIARIRLDGTGIDRLYKIDLDSHVYVWDNESWDDIGHVDSDIYTYDKMLDDPYDTVAKDHVVIDPGSAIVISARFMQSPFSNVSVEDIDQDEASLVALALPGVDWGVVDYALTAATEPASAGDGVYTPEERSKNTRRQLRDASGKFTAQGSRVVVGGDTQNGVGFVRSINPDSGTVRVELDNGETVEVAANTTDKVDKFISSMVDVPEMPPLDVSGILAQPRTPIDRPGARIPGTLPALTAADLQSVLYDWPAWVQRQRESYVALPDPEKVDVTGPYTGDPRFRKPKFDDGTGYDVYTDPSQHPMLKNWGRKNPGGGTSKSSGKGKSKGSGTATAKGSGLYVPPSVLYGMRKKSGYYGGGTTASAKAKQLTPDTSDVRPLFAAIVSPDDPRAVLDLISVVPADASSNLPMAYKRVDGEWVRDEGILADLNSATPPPVVPLDADTLKDVISQIDGGAITAAGSFALDHMLMVLWGPTVEGPDVTDMIGNLFSDESVEEEEDQDLVESDDFLDMFSITSAGGLDRNRGGAAKLRRYWTIGKGGAKIRWNTGGDWTRCVRQLSKYMGPRAKGYCSLRHKEMTGMWPGDRRNRKKFATMGGEMMYSDNFVASTEEVLDKAALNARRNESVRKFAMIAGGYEESSAPKDGAKFRIPLVIPENKESGDGRKFANGAIDIRELPLPLLWQIKTGEGHMGSVVVGRIDFMERMAEGIGNAYGVFDTGEYGKEAERLVREGFIRGVSADMDKFEAEEVEASEDTEEKVENGKLKITQARVMAVTIVPKPAFQECKIILVDDMNNEKQEETVIPDGVYVEDVDPMEASALVACGMVAGAIPVAPPAQWFDNPKLNKATPITVDDDGRVFGHIAAWNVDHIGMTFGTKPPRSRSKYAYFHTGVVRTEDGSDVPVGQLTLAGGHAGLEASAVEAARHYDDTGSAIADVHAGEDAYGIWVAGSLRPSATPEQIRALRASAPSGDWRPIKGKLELVAVCQVNVPGFPIARAMVAGGQVMALVAAGAHTLARMKSDPVTELNARIAKLEQLETDKLSAKVTELSTRFVEAREIRNAELSAKAEELADRVFSEVEFEDGFGYIPRRERKKLAKSGQAMPDGSFPITSVDSLRDSIQAYGRGKPSRRPMIRRHIMKRARQLDRADLIPENWKSAASDEIEFSVNSMREKITSLAASVSTEAVAQDNEAELSAQEAGDSSLGKAPAVEFVDIAGDAKYVSGKTQPRDAQGKFRQVLARIKQNAGDSGLQNVLDKVEETEGLDNTGNYVEAARSATDLIGLIDRIDTGAVSADSLETIRESSKELGETVANLPLPFGENTVKVRYSDLPPALRDLIEDMISRVEDKIGQEDADEATADLRSFMSGGDYFNQSEVSSNLSKLLRLLT
jgi:hypothetical protein